MTASVAPTAAPARTAGNAVTALTPPAPRAELVEAGHVRGLSNSQTTIARASGATMSPLAGPVATIAAAREAPVIRSGGRISAATEFRRGDLAPEPEPRLAVAPAPVNPPETATGPPAPEAALAGSASVPRVAAPTASEATLTRGPAATVPLAGSPRDGPAPLLATRGLDYPLDSGSLAATEASGATPAPMVAPAPNPEPSAAEAARAAPASVPRVAGPEPAAARRTS